MSELRYLGEKACSNGCDGLWKMGLEGKVAVSEEKIDGGRVRRWK